MYIYIFFLIYSVEPSPVKQRVWAKIFWVVHIDGLTMIHSVAYVLYFVIVFQDTALDPGEDVALLSVSFEDAEATQVFPKLYLSPSIEQ